MLPVLGLLLYATFLAEHHDDFACGNWISFRVGPDGCYRFLGRPAFFEIEAVEASAAAASAGAAESEHVDELTALHGLYAEAEAQLAGTRTRWERLGGLVWGDERDPTQQREGWGTDISILDELGGAPGSGNWVAFPPSRSRFDNPEAASSSISSSRDVKASWGCCIRSSSRTANGAASAAGPLSLTR